MRELRVVIADVGSLYTKAGVGGERLPRLVIPTVLGERRPDLLSPFVTIPDVAIGDQALSKRRFMRLHWPVERGHVRDWSAWAKFISLTLRRMRVSPEECVVVIPFPPLTPDAERLKAAEILIEQVGVAGIFFPLSPLLTLYASRKDTALVIESGDGITTVTPIVDGVPILEAAQRLNLAGRDVTEALLRMLQQRGLMLGAESLDLVRRIKEEHCYVALEPEKERDKALKVPRLVASEATLPDGTKVTLTYERFEAPEVLFTPGKFAVVERGIHEAAYLAVSKCDESYWPLLLSNVILSGGNVQLRNLALRLKAELVKMFPDYADKVSVTLAEQPMFADFLGASILSRIESFMKWVLTRDKWRTEGPEAVLKMM